MRLVIHLLGRSFATSIIARLPLEMISIALVVHTQRRTGFCGGWHRHRRLRRRSRNRWPSLSPSIVGGRGGRARGQLDDRRRAVGRDRGPPPALPQRHWSHSRAGSASLHHGRPLPATQIPALTPDPDALGKRLCVRGFDGGADLDSRPPIALCAGALWSTGTVLALAGVYGPRHGGLLAAQLAARGWRRAASGTQSQGHDVRRRCGPGDCVGRRRRAARRG